MERYFLVQQLKESSSRPIRISLHANEVSIGRRGFQTALEIYPQVSRDHAKFVKSDSGMIFVQDLNSSNGVYVNGTKIKTSIIHHVKEGDFIGFGVPSLEVRDGFVCVLTKEVQVKPEVIDLIDDEGEDAALGNLAVNCNHVKDISMRLVSIGTLEPLHNVKSESNGIKDLKNGMAPLVNGIQSTSSNSYALNRTDASETPGPSVVELSPSSESDNSNHDVVFEDNVNNTLALNKIKPFETSRINSCASGSSSTNKSDNSKHVVGAEHNIINTFALNKIKTSGTPGISESKSCTTGPSSSNRSDNSQHGVEVEQNMKNTSTLNEMKVTEPYESLKLKFRASGHGSYAVDIPRCDVVQNSINTSAPLRTSGSSKKDCSVDRIKLKTCKVVLKKCDNENFEFPTEVKLPFKKQKIEEETAETDSFLRKKRKRIRRLSDSSEDDNLENNITENATQRKHRKRKIVRENVFHPSNDPFVSHKSSEDDFSDASVRNRAKNKSQIQEQNSFKRIENVGSYSQDGDDIIVISDDDVYLDSQTCALIKEEPPDVQEDIDNVNEDALLRQIFDDSESAPVSQPPNIDLHEYNDNVESIEAIAEFFGSSKKKSAYEAGKNDIELEHGSLILECEASEEENDSGNNETSEEESNSGNDEADSDSSNEELQLQAFFSAKLPLGSSVVENSQKNEAHASKDKVDDCFNSIADKGKTFNKSTGRTLLTEPKPLQQRSRKMRGREEGFTEQQKYQQPSTPKPRKQPQRSTKASKPSPKKVQKRTEEAVRLQIGNANSGLRNFKIPRKSETQSKKKMLKENEPFTNSKEFCSKNSRPSVSVPKKIIPAVKSRREGFGCRSTSLMEDVPIKQIKRGKPAIDKVKLNSLREVGLCSAEKQINSNLIQVPILQETSKSKKPIDISPNNVSKYPNKRPISVNSNEDTPDHLNLKSNHLPTSRILKPPTESPVPLNASNLKDQGAREHSRWVNPSTSHVSKTPNKEPVHSSEDTSPKKSDNKKPKDKSPNNASKPFNNASLPSKLGDLKNACTHSRLNQPTRNTPELRSNDQSTSCVSHILNNVPVPLNPRDPRQAKTEGIVKTRAQEVKKSSIDSPSTSSSASASISSLTAASTSTLKTKGFKRPTSSNRTNTNESFEISYLILAKKLINLRCIWLSEQEKNDVPPREVSKGANALPLQFKSYDSYVSSFYPMMMLEIWDYMYTESKEVFKNKNRAVNKFYFTLLDSSKKTDCIELKCESYVSEKVFYSPREGSLVILELKDAPKKNIQHVFGYIFKHSVDKLNMRSLKGSKWETLGPTDWLDNAKQWSFYVYVKTRDMHLEKGNLMKGNGICYIRSKLRLADALGQLKNSSLLSSIINPCLKTFEVNYPKKAKHTREYTSCQVRVIEGIFSEIVEKPRTEPKIVLVQGPPGTGKTHTIVGLLEKIVMKMEIKNKFMRILVVAPSNAAVDEIGCRLIDLNDQNQICGTTIIFVRVGSEKQIHKKILPYFLDRQASERFKQNMNTAIRRKDKELEDLQKEIDEIANKSPTFKGNDSLRHLKNKQNRLKEKHIKREMDYHTEMSNKGTILKECHVVLSTLNSCGLSILSRTFKQHSDVEFTCCIMDESTQCTEVEVLQPLMFGINKLVLVGDHQQLPATVTSKLACKYGFTRSMFERFYLYFERSHCTNPVFPLTEQFRMHSEVCSFPSKHFYKKMLVTDPDTDIRYSRYPINPYVVLDILNSQENNEFSSKTNDHEASVIASICKSLLKVIDSPSSIGIITPYQGQRSLYEKSLHQNPNYRAIEINTVDGFQGREKEVIIMSCVRANSHSGSIGFLGNRNRLNVAITRAKKCLIICCHANSLKQNPDWNALINDATSRDVLHSVTSKEDIPHIFDKYIMKKR